MEKVVIVGETKLSNSIKRYDIELERVGGGKQNDRATGVEPAPAERRPLA